MEIEIVRRRTKILAAHLSFQEDISATATATHVLPMSCSNTLNSVIRRYDNRTNFARQGSASQGCYMRPALNEQGIGNYVQPFIPSKSRNSGEKRFDSLDDEPSFSRPARVEPGVPTLKGVQPVEQTNSALEAPVFARPTKECGQPLLHYEENAHNSAQKGSVWSPRMDVVESGLSYLLTIEIPGVSTDNVKVEVDDQSLIISGKRFNWSCAAPDSNKPVMSYRRREILQGPYRIVWPLPSNTRRDNVSAEIQDGLLRVTIPKLSGLRWLRKVYI